MKPETRTVNELFERDVRYSVPLYQRPYVWDLDDQWEPLWGDLLVLLDHQLANGGGAASYSHFLGAIDRALAVLGGLGPDDRLALHWAMCGLAYPFYLDAAAVAGRMLDVRDTIALTPFRARLSERWGVGGTMPQASQRLLRTWERWGVLAAVGPSGLYQSTGSVAVSSPAAALVAEARVRAAAGTSMDLEDLQRAADLFPFALPDLREVLRGASGVQVVRQGGSGWVVRGVREPGS